MPFTSFFFRSSLHCALLCSSLSDDCLPPYRPCDISPGRTSPTGHSPLTQQSGAIWDWPRHDLSRDKIKSVYDSPLLDLLIHGTQVHRHSHNFREVQQCTLLSIKTGGCSEVCSYCPQSSGYDMGLKAQKLMNKNAIIDAAKKIPVNYQNIHGQTPSKLIYRPLPRQDQNADSYKDLMHVQSVTIPSGTSSLCNGSNNHVNSNGVGSAGHGSNSYLNSNGIGSVCNGSNNHSSSNGIGSVCNGSVRNIAVTINAADNGINDGRYANEGVGIMNFRKLSEREATLNKFRLKRKDRCFEKKVRYQSRKKLAEQRP